jgi:hypothetical protein
MEDPIKAAARARVAELVRNFQRNEADYLRTDYNETQARTDFITPLFEAFGWDVHNKHGQSSALREVIEEATVEVGEERFSKKPDYELRLAQQRKLFVEAKKPSVRIDHSRDACFQTRRYGFSASLPIAVLTNFRQLAIYDCLTAPSDTDEANVARLSLIEYEEFETRFDELWSQLSRQAVYSGEFDRRFAVDVTRHGAAQFDDFFLGQVRSWRARLAADIHANTPGLTSVELSYAVQLFLSRIVFLRICEDRDIERYKTLQTLPVANTFAALTAELRRADQFYDSGLFDLLGDARLGIRISDDVLHGIIAELYYPQSPYTFAVIETEVLGEIYEQFLGEEITVTGGIVEIVNKPEVRESGGGVATPRAIVDAIVQRTLLPALAGKSPADIANFTVADICCGSGVFLLAVYEFLIDYYLSWYLGHNRSDHNGHTIYEATAGQWRLTFEEKRRILLAHVRGVDIDTNAVEVSRFSLLLKLIENETAAGLRDFVTRQGTPALPALDETIRSGNSLVSQAEWATACGPMPTALIEKVNPFTWETEFSAEMGRGGFNVIVANPPYIRIQNMTAYSPQEVVFYKKAASPYSTAHQDNFDKYALFIERALHLLQPDGRLGMITPHKFMTTHAGHALRELLAAGRFLENVIHFGVQHVFGRQVLNYTCILVMDRRGLDIVRVERVKDLEAWRYGGAGAITDIPADTLTADNWQFADEDTRTLFERIRTAFPARLDQLAEIFVGVQTSKDDLYIFEAVAETETTLSLRWNGRDWPIEREILRPCLMDAPLLAFARPKPNTWMIFPYELITGGHRGTKARLISPANMQTRFPGCLAYLGARRAELEARSITGGAVGERQFYQFGRSQSLVKFNSPKIILPVLSVEPRYAYDDSNIMVTGGGNGPYYMVRPRDGMGVSNHFLLAVLNHPLSEAFIRTNTSLFQGSYYSHGKQFIENLPIPVPTDAERIAIEELVQQMIDALAAIEAARTPDEITRRKRQAENLRGQIEERVTTLFNLSPTDMEVVRAVPVPV